MTVSMSEVRKAIPRGMAFAVMVAFILLNGLGIWQLERLKWKEGLIADMARTEAMAPLPVSELLALRRPDWRSAKLPICVIPADHLIYMHSEVSGTPGFRILTACSGLLVDLGFSEAKLSDWQSVTILPEGRLRPFEKSGTLTPVNRPLDHDWYWRSAGEMGSALKVRVRDDFFLVLDLKLSHTNIHGLSQGPLTAPLPNRHFEYALTWFGLGWALLGVFGSVIYQRYKKANTFA